MRIGQGFDVHPLVSGRKLVIGGVEISHHNGLVAMMGALDAEDWGLVHDAARPRLPENDLRVLLKESSQD